jgi:cell division protein ZapA
VAQIAVTLNGRTYRLSCAPGEEPRLVELAAHVKMRMDTLLREFGNVGDDRLLLMTALMIADEFFDARDALALSNKVPSEQAATPATTDKRQPRKVNAA